MGILQLTSRQIGCSDIAWGNGAFSWVDENNLSHTAFEVNAAQIPTTSNELVNNVVGGWITVRTEDELAAAITYVGANNYTIYMHRGAYSLTADLTVPANVNLWPDLGALITLNDFDVAVNGYLQAGPWQVFNCNGTGRVTIGAKVGYILPEWWYSGTGDFGPSLQFAIDSRSAGSAIPLLNTSYSFTTGVTATNNIHIFGRGDGATSITFTPVAPATLFDFVYAPAGVSDSSRRCSLKGLSLAGAGVQAKTFVRCMDVREFGMDWVKITDTTGVGSIGVLFKGRDTSTFTNLYITADRPIVFGANPTASAISIDIVGDGCRFGPNLLTECNADAGKNVEFLDEKMWVSALTFDGIFMNNGTHGIYWSDTTSTLFAKDISIHNSRYERPDADGGYAVYLDHKLGINNFSIKNFTAGGNSDVAPNKSLAAMIYLKKVYYAYLEGVFANNSLMTIPMEANTCKEIVFNSCHWLPEGTPPTMTGMTKVFGTSKWFGAGTNTQRVFEHWTNNGDGAYHAIYNNGAPIWHWAGSLTNGSSKAGVAVSDMDAWTLTVTAHQDGGAGLECGIFYGGEAAGLAKLQGSTNTDAADSAGNLCCYINAGTLTIKNNLGYTANIVIDLKWNSPVG